MSYARILADLILEYAVHFARMAASVEAQISPLPTSLHYF
jgi:hypothetical protein